MWLLNVHTYALEYFIGDSMPPYAILSHTWGDGEVSFKDMQEHSEEAARLDGWSYAWVDTCCIDKSSSAELSENINSMYRYYSHSQACYVYLLDVHGHGKAITGENVAESTHQQDPLDLPNRELYKDFAHSRWFTRGWCLQELVAPKNLYFYDQEWKCLARKNTLIQSLSKITGVDASVLLDPDVIGRHCIARRMYWAARRSTTRAEDRAYSLLGIFDVNMPLLYGERGTRAFERLQQEIIRTSTDHSIFAWDSGKCLDSLLADSPADFSNAAAMISWVHTGIGRSFSLSNVGLIIEVPIIEIGTAALAVLNCRFEDDLKGPICLKLKDLKAGNERTPREGLAGSARLFAVHCNDSEGSELHQHDNADGSFDRLPRTRLIVEDLELANSAKVSGVVVSLNKRAGNFHQPAHYTTLRLLLDLAIDDQFQVIEAWPPNEWTSNQLVIRPHLNDDGTCWGYVTLQHQRPPFAFKISIGVLVLAGNHDPYRSKRRLSLVQHRYELSVPQMRQYLTDSYGSLSRITFEHSWSQLPDIQAEILAPEMIMNSIVHDIKVSLLL